MPHHLVSAITDSYDRKARFFPSLLVLMPLLVVGYCAFGPERPALTSILTLVFGAGGAFGLSVVTRLAGKRLEDKVVNAWGGMPSTTLLRHRNPHYNRYTKERYHAQLAQMTGTAMPTRDAEASDPADADERYEFAARALRNATRGADFRDLRRENIYYGYYRNCLALKAVGLAVSALATVWGLGHAGLIERSQPYFAFDRLMTLSPTEATAILGPLLIATIWLFFNREGLRRISVAYSERLFECLDHLSPDGLPGHKNSKGKA
jgi:hypothetical protein